LAQDLEALGRQLDAVCDQAAELEKDLAGELCAVHPGYAESARNLVHYLALRRLDLRELQQRLGQFGLSSLGAAEQHVLASLRAVRFALHKLASGNGGAGPGPVEFEQSQALLVKHSNDLLGSNPDGRSVEIMVTLPTDAATNYPLVHDLLMTGMDIARINCAHDTPAEWREMAANLRRACAETGRACRLFVDLAGPKLRTGPMTPGPGVLRIRPRRDVLGRVIAPKRLRFIAADTPWPGKKQAVVPVPVELIEVARVGDSIVFRDTRGRRRRLAVVAKDDKGLVLETDKRAYLATGTKLTLKSQNAAAAKRHFRVGGLPEAELPITLFTGDLLKLDRGDAAGEAAVTADDGAVLQPAHIGCLPPEALDRVAAGATVWLNDGKIRGTVENTGPDGLSIRIDRAKRSGSRLRAGQSINFPGTTTGLRGLTESDRGNLEFVSEYADAVCLSFVRSPAEVIELQQAIATISDRQIGIVPKIETEEGFRELPRILLAAMRSYPVGIMIARGDLAVECGWERLAEIQEEILWMCEAAHIPVIWATQVLEGEAKKGMPSRAEITDAAMSQRADCVMLNKGPHILAAIRMLDNILRRMQDHQQKKSPRLRRLSITELPGQL